MMGMKSNAEAKHLEFYQKYDKFHVLYKMKQSLMRCYYIF